MSPDVVGDRNVPRQLPPDPFGFTGRTTELAELDRLLELVRAPTAVVISAVSGMAGVGKTALAVHWAHRVGDRFPDGQLHADLRGFDSGVPVPPSEALAGFLRSLGVPGAEVPSDLAERSARYRSLTAGRRMLVLLDNAASAEQVRPLLPGSGTCLVLVTSRDDLPGLIAHDGARRIDLDVLSRPEALALLRTLIGVRADTEAADLAEIAERCSGLPLALRVLAERVITRPLDPLACLAAELSDERRRLDLLNGPDDPVTAVRAVFSWSVRHLTPAAAQAFRLLGLHPGQHIDDYALAALAGCDLASARFLLDQLVRAHLLQHAGPAG